jgi:hypothetical protein
MTKTWTEEQRSHIESVLDELPPASQPMTTPALVTALRPKIRKALERGYTIDEIVVRLRAAGYELPLSTLRAYSREQPVKKRSPRRKGEAA